MPTTDSKIHLITTTTESPMRNVDKGHLFATTPPLAKFQFRATNRGSAALTKSCLRAWPPGGTSASVRLRVCGYLVSR
jgi:hypothetical protein